MPVEYTGLSSSLSDSERAEKIAGDIRARMAARNTAGGQGSGGGDEGGSLFEALVDTVNPLQHIPGVSSVYRATTGDTINPLSAMAGGMVFAGPLGLIAGAAGAFIEALTGKSPAEHALALLNGASEHGEPENPAGKTVAANGGSATENIMAKDPLLVVAPLLGGAGATAFAEAEGRLNSGVGAGNDTVSLAANIWESSLLGDGTDPQSGDRADKTPA